MPLPEIFATMLATVSSGSSQYSPTFVPGGLIAWLICSRRKKQAVGGWLLYYYWQLYAGLLVSTLFFAMNLQSYIPENFNNLNQFALFLGSTVPTLVLFLMQCAVATLLLVTRTWDVLRLLRCVMAFELGASVIAAGIDSKFYPDNLGIDVLTIVPTALWVAYFFLSKRVKHVFQRGDWDVVVDRIYPSQPRIAT